ncbi:hypothetical protein COO91_03114 [Nostoc flagelliforme CCNUN1]|uniref:Uncharacterized protein n=1 Tax=Nostoc flagelliforme CCNUN1 TaxID=2038116 RepID=A0A2K8SNX5_9NOSO|nr:hypothetical protein COO91_03114 [Nostoc flagelliforme CCNUN1]
MLIDKYCLTLTSRKWKQTKERLAESDWKWTKHKIGGKI